MSEMPPIDLSGLEGKWSKTSNRCAICGKDFDHVDSENDDDTVPLQLFRGEGKEMEMMTFCWNCAQTRMPHKPHNN